RHGSPTYTVNGSSGEEKWIANSAIASGAEIDVIMSINYISDKVVFYLRPDGAFNYILTTGEIVSGSPRRLTVVGRDTPREAKAWTPLFDPVTPSARENSGSREFKE
ncbi:unnamed protein product, partial [Clonostachys solani]